MSFNGYELFGRVYLMVIMSYLAVCLFDGYHEPVNVLLDCVSGGIF